MERVALLIEDTGELLRCMLNPESIVVERATGLTARRASGGPIGGIDLADEPLLYSGAGRFEFTLDLLFDIGLSTTPPDIDDVRQMTGGLWRLAENSGMQAPMHRPPIVRFIWGKAWNVPAVVTAASERLEQFTSEGVPRRSWLRLRLRRVVEPPHSAEPEAPPASALVLDPDSVDEALVDVHQPIGAGPQGGPGAGERLEQIAAEHYGHPAYWRLLATFNDLDDPLHLPESPLRLPPRPAEGSAS